MNKYSELTDLIYDIATHMVGTIEPERSLLQTEILDYLNSTCILESDSDEDSLMAMFELGIAAMNYAHDYGLYALNHCLTSKWELQLGTNDWHVCNDADTNPGMIYHDVLVKWAYSLAS